MAKDELTGNVPTEKLLSFLTAQKAQNSVNMLHFESAYNVSLQVC
jgi:hydroxymethylglutaryl-CoA lyase